jgi:hypothetical protein
LNEQFPDSRHNKPRYDGQLRHRYSEARHHSPIRKLPGANAGTGASQWSGVLPKDGQYIIAVAPTRGGATYKLAVAIKRKWDLVFENFGRTVLYTLAELEVGDRRNLVDLPFFKNPQRERVGAAE